MFISLELGQSKIQSMAIVRILLWDQEYPDHGPDRTGGRDIHACENTVVILSEPLAEFNRLDSDIFLG